MPEIIYMKKSEYDKMCAAELREKYLKKTPTGYSKSEIRNMSDNAILDMDYFLNEEHYDCYDEDYDNYKGPDVIYRIVDDSPRNPEEDDIPY